LEGKRRNGDITGANGRGSFGSAASVKIRLTSRKKMNRMSTTIYNRLHYDLTELVPVAKKCQMDTKKPDSKICYQAINEVAYALGLERVNSFCFASIRKGGKEVQ
jgi:hypothetical protein